LFSINWSYFKRIIAGLWSSFSGFGVRWFESLKIALISPNYWSD